MGHDWCLQTLNILVASHHFKICFISGLFDQIIHSADNIDIQELFKHLHPMVNDLTSVLILSSMFFIKEWKEILCKCRFPGDVRLANIRRNQSSVIFSFYCRWLWGSLLQSYMEWGLNNSLLLYVIRLSKSIISFHFLASFNLRSFMGSFLTFLIICFWRKSSLIIEFEK